MVSTEKIIAISDKMKDAGEFKASKQYIGSTDLGYEQITEYFSEIFSGTEFSLDDDQTYDLGPHCTFYVKGPNASYEHRWQIDVLRADDEVAKDDIGSYLALDIEEYIKPGDKYLIIVFDNDARFDQSE